MDRGCIQIYTGNGKGKTTAALGILLRAVASNYKCLLVQFMKKGFPYTELESLKQFSSFVTIETIGSDDHVLEKRPPNKTEIQEIKSGLEFAKETLKISSYDVVILDEISTVCHFGLCKNEDVIELFTNWSDTTELILTGRYCPENWFEYADLVTEMKEIKHYYQKGVESRKGIDF
ncbi:MAG: cob(I)yrinic acid a,c-diamide adenosyltransferase [Calditrichaeota bacterium]|jgi:cob(I)alamin adenosyltransferase|nr:cob(I)yrinic acid a,c-diamide adenosyltransferase [Calditrichota bacterium]MBT7618752.1 cob(I)yrinic acid a,c-diamide adenosyltransferase [Calditrichota bacterium]MBT7789618.1 cob(I)yrinic acid a,c-diamide adenosyltransferase [Calditrichota bacterium]